MSSIWGNVVFPQKDGFVYGAQEPNVPCLWFNSGGGSTPADPDVSHGMLLYRDNEDVLHPLYPMTTMAAVYGLKEALNQKDENLMMVAGGLRYFYGTVALPVSGWTGDTAPFTQTVALDGIQAADYPRYGLILSGTTEERLKQVEAFGLIHALETGDGTVTFTCLDDKPDTDLTVQIREVRWDEPENIAALMLDEDESGYAATASVDGETYGLKNVTVNSGATAQSYDFTVL